MLIVTAMSSDHNDKAVRAFFKQLEQAGFTITRKRNGGYVIAPPANIANQVRYHTHATRKSLLPLRRDISKMYGISL